MLLQARHGEGVDGRPVGEAFEIDREDPVREADLFAPNLTEELCDAIGVRVEQGLRLSLRHRLVLLLRDAFQADVAVGDVEIDERRIDPGQHFGEPSFGDASEEIEL